MTFIIGLLINAAALYVATRIVDGISFTGSWKSLLGVALVFAIVNTLVKPVLQFLSFPVIFLTLGIFLLVINALMLLLTSSVSRSFGLGFSVRGFGAALFGSIVISLVSMVLSALLLSGRND
jgi:putative membrane protein